MEHLNPRKLPAHGGDATTVMVTITEESLIKRLATGGLIDADLSAGDNLSAEAIRRLACNAGIIPVVLGGKGEILDLGRTRRLFSPAQRKAMALRDKTCRGEGCTVPAPWCEVHHLKPWSQGGKTDIAHGIHGCNHHHHLLHDPNYTHEILPNGDIRFHRRR
nr:HNH endonuclease signature motif containing protein [Nocardioides immobilis]